jgi:hypothetical protein
MTLPVGCAAYRTVPAAAGGHEATGGDTEYVHSPASVGTFATGLGFSDLGAHIAVLAVLIMLMKIKVGMTMPQRSFLGAGSTTAWGHRDHRA